MIERYHSAITLSLARYPLAVRAGMVGLGAGIVLLAAWALAPHPLKLLLAVAYIAVGGAALLGGALSRSSVWDLPAQIALSALTAFGLLFYTAFDSWWLALAALALLFTLLAAQDNPERALLLAAAHLAGALVALGVRWWSLYPPLTTEHVLLGFALLVLGQLGVIVLTPARVSVPAAIPAAADAYRPGADFAENVAHLVTHIQVTADGLTRATQAINDVTTQQSQGAADQVNIIGQANELLEHFLKSSEQIREQARSVTLMAGHTAEFSEKGQAAIAQAIDGMHEIRAQVSAIAQTIVKLGQLTRRIDEIIMSVSEIATQSNLLALNASIEAARAGAHGRGFAVVAEEVRTLSQQSTSAAQQVRAILGEIQSAMRETIDATQVGMQGVDGGVALTQEADKVMVHLAENVNESYRAVKSIFDVIRQQMEDLEQIAINMDMIDRITQQNLTSTRMVETVSSNLTNLAAELQDALDRDVPALTRVDDQDLQHDGEDRA